jgi:hypothetical protein
VFKKEIFSIQCAKASISSFKGEVEKVGEKTEKIWLLSL